MRVLVLVADYPNPDGEISLYYTHARNKYYLSRGINVSVLNFAAKCDYVIDSIPVYTGESYKKRLKNPNFDLLICHAPNLRNHYLFLLKYERLFPNIVFIFHGHEVLRCSKVYPQPYAYVKSENAFRSLIRDCYDIIKLYIWKSTFEKITYKSWFIFVSEWMYNEFIQWTRVDPLIIKNKKRIIYNCIGTAFETECYDTNALRLYDFVTIRGSLDGSKYCIDVVTELARCNPQYSFCVAGRGDFFKHNAKPNNITFIDKYLNHPEIIDLLNNSRCALMPTRTDAQGVMACEMATFGIPLITSDIPICREVFNGFNNVAFISNETPTDLSEIFEKITRANQTSKNIKYFLENTSGREVDLFKEIVEETDQ